VRASVIFSDSRYKIAQNQENSMIYPNDGKSTGKNSGSAGHL
jgi:hypothetical protein